MIGDEVSKVKPDHYKAKYGNDLINFALDNDIGAIEFNIIKYVVRYKEKNGIEDLKKAQEYLKRLIKYQNKEK